MKNSFRLLVGVIGMLLFIGNLIVWFIPIVIFSILKFFLPIPFIKNGVNALLNQFASCWISVNSVMAAKLCRVEVEWPENANFSTKDWYMVIANHQSWVDIYVLQRIFNRKIPFLKFFLKKELIYVPVLGIAWWALDFPFMQRHSKSYLKKNPHKKGSDLATTKKACEKFKHIPISVMNFAEGTRFTPQKSAKQESPYQHLLKPKSGGIGTVLSILGEQMHNVVDATIVYPDGIPSFWDFLCGRVGTIKVVVRQFDVESHLIGDMTQQDTRRAVQSWLNQIWEEKDAIITKKLNS